MEENPFKNVAVSVIPLPMSAAACALSEKSLTNRVAVPAATQGRSDRPIATMLLRVPAALPGVWRATGAVRVRNSASSQLSAPGATGAVAVAPRPADEAAG